MLKSGIYQIVGPGKVYVGQAQDVKRRLNAHRSTLKIGKHENSHLQRAWNKHGEGAFVFEALAFFSVEELDEAEQYLLDRLPPLGKYNIAIDAIASSRGRKLSDETKAKLRAANVGKKISADTKAKISLSSKGKAKPPGFGEKIRKAKLGKTRSSEAKAAMSASKKGKPLLHMPSAKLTPQQVHEIRAGFLFGAAQKDLAVLFNISRPQVCGIIKGNFWV